MKAAQFFAARDVRVVDIPKPVPKEDEALIAIEWCGICGSDLHEYLHGPMGVPTKERPHPLTKEYGPLTMGHEFVGRVISAPVGSNLSPGQAVMIDPRICCNNCRPCNLGYGQGCSILGFRGLSGGGGGFQEEVAVDVKACYALPDSIDINLAALIEPLAVGWHAVDYCEIPDWSNQTALVMGGGPIGIAVMIVLRAQGCKQIIVSEPSAKRAAQNKQIADAVFNPITDKIGEECRKLTDGKGADVVFDCAGVQAGLDAGMDAIKYRGLYMNAAVWSKPMEIPFWIHLLKETTNKCSFAYDNKDLQATIDAFAAGKFKHLETMVSSRIHVDDISEKGFDELVTNKDQIKILVTPDKTKV